MTPEESDLFNTLVNELQSVDGPRRRSKLVEFKKAKRAQCDDPKMFDKIFSIAFTIFDLGTAENTWTIINMRDNSTTDNSINVGSVTGNGNAFGSGARASAGDFVQLIKSATVDQSLKNSLVEARELLNDLIASEASKSMTISSFEQLSNEAIKPQPDPGILNQLWVSIQAGASSLMKFKPFIELGLFITKIANHGQ